MRCSCSAKIFFTKCQTTAVECWHPHVKLLISDELYGDFEDLETGEKHFATTNDDDDDVDDDDDDDKKDKGIDFCITYNPLPDDKL